MTSTGVSAAAELLDLELVVLYVYDEESGVLTPRSWSSAVETLIGAPATVQPGDTPVWQAYRAGRIIRDCYATEEQTLGATTGEAIFPLDEHGVLLVGTRGDPGEPRDASNIPKLLTSNLAGALERMRREERLRERETELERQNDRLDEFASIVSHDLRNPLNVATGRLELACDECDSPHLAEIDRALERMDTLIEDLLDFARVGAAATEIESVAIHALAEPCWTLVETHDATLHVEDELTVSADPARVKRLLENLFRNAVVHGGEHVTVRVGTLEDREGFYVADDGPGIGRKDRDRVLESGFSGVDGGTGFGLAIVAEIAEAHAWDVEVHESEAGGARIEIRVLDPDHP